MSERLLTKGESVPLRCSSLGQSRLYHLSDFELGSTLLHDQRPGGFHPP